MRGRILTTEECALLMAGLAALITQGRNEMDELIIGSEAHALQGRELNLLRDLQADIRICGVQLLP